MTTASASETEVLRKTVREVFADQFPSATVRQQMVTENGYDPAVWQRLAGEVGLAGTAVAEEYGGSGLTLRELGVMFEEAGRCLAAAPLFSVAGLAIPLLQEVGDQDALARWLPALCEGSLTATVVTCDADGRVGPDHVAIAADGEVLTGRAGYVVDGITADLILVPARAGDELVVFAVERTAPGVTVTPLVTLDQTRKQAHVTFDAAPGTRLAGRDHREAIERALTTSSALLSCELVGVAQQSLDLTVDYAKSRVQFGRAIGSFQAIKQKLAELLIKVESARSAATAAVAACADVSQDRGWTSSVAKAYASESAVQAGEDSIQLHGGIGFTWEHDAHLYYKRARTGLELLGTPREHYAKVGDHLETL